MIKNKKKALRLRRHRRIRKKIFGHPQRPRLCVYRSNAHIYAQLIDDLNNKTLVFASSLAKDIKGKVKNGGNAEAAEIVGKLIAERSMKAGIKEVVFDRGGYLYHGRVKALADAARKQGLKF